MNFFFFFFWKAPTQSWRNLAWADLYCLLISFSLMFVLRPRIDSWTLISTLAMKDDFFPPLSLLSCAYQPFQLRLFFSLLMISSLFGKSTLRHSREMSIFGWGKITVVLDLLNSLFHSVLNSHSTGSLSLYLLTHYYPLLLPYNYRSIIWFMSQTINNSGTLCFCKSSSCTFSNNPFNFL